MNGILSISPEVCYHSLVQNQSDQMKSIIEYLEEYAREQWDHKLFLAVGLLLTAGFAINYGLISEASILRKINQPFLQFVFYFFFYGIPYAVTLTLHSKITGKDDCRSNPKFLALCVFTFIILSAYVTFHNVPAYVLRTSPTVFQLMPQEFHWYIMRYASNLLPGFAVILPLVWFWIKHDYETSRFYGFSASHIDLRTYYAIILMLVPVVAIASFGSDFQSAYPRYKFGLPQSAVGVERAMLISGFEVCYGVDFMFVELLFRGFMVMAFARYLGSASILPMVVVYAFLHFQKPIGEAIGSIIGGLVLGIIAYRTQSIYGGIILHLGIAYLMEIAGTVQLLLR